MITQNYIKNQVKKIKNIKYLLCRKRLRFTVEEISYYLFMIVLHQEEQIEFKQLYYRYKDSHSYSNFMHNIQLCSKLIKALFYNYNKTISIQPSTQFNIVDSTLIPTLLPESIKQKHFNENKVTLRIKNNVKHYIAGIKAFLFINKQKYIYRGDLMNINTPDNIITKNPITYNLKGILLADRGFNSKEIRKRSYGLYRLISPYRKTEKKTLSLKEQKLYKQRWCIETVYKQLKDRYKEFKLMLNNRYSQPIQEGVFYITCLKYNISLSS